LGNSHASALRRVAKRRLAFTNTRPFIIATVGFADAYVYTNGYLCYTLDDKVRILDLYHSSQEEIVLSIPGLLTHALSEIDDSTTGTFQILYYANNIISCVFRTSGEESAWLIAFSLSFNIPSKKRILVTEELDSTDKIFVRNNQDFLYYGTHSEVGTDGYKKWAIHGYDLRTRKKFDQKIQLSEMVGSDIGSTVSFEFHAGYFYALSNQTSFEVEEIDWTSFYHCIRFPLASPHKDLLEKTDNHRMWRRQHQEGPIDDRWTSLRLDSDESTGELRIVESRKEWYLGNSRSQRTYYTTQINFCKSNDQDTSELSGAPSTYSTDPTSLVATSASSSTETTAVTTNTFHSSDSPKHHHDLSVLPQDDPLTKLLRPDDNPHHMRPPLRLPQNTHPEQVGSNQPVPTHTLAKSRIRSYHTSCSTFIDLVDDPLPTDWECKQRLRLRTGSRRLGPPLFAPYSGPGLGLLRAPSEDLQTALNEMYRVKPISYWPPNQNYEQPDPDIDTLYKLMNPPSHLGNVEGVIDDRSILYVTGGNDKPKAIIFIGFDPAIRFVGLRRWGGLEKREKGVGEGPHIDGRATGYGKKEGEIGKEIIDEDESGEMVGIDRKGKSKERGDCIPVVQITGGDTQTGRNLSGKDSWIWKENAMYRDINLGFHFCA
jgi:hypothetical protein